ncbi:MAG: gene transfer agent family protein [Planctomycetes bacterium]|nr:gene transfer agent family protein [Planctomycetota bacterium]
MATIWRDVAITWNGKTHTFRPTMEFLNHLEQKPGRSISAVFLRLSRGDLPSGVACEIIADTLAFAGVVKETADGDVSVTAADVFEIHGGVGVEAVTTVQTILLACMPTPKTTESTKKKPEPVTTAKSSKRKKPTGHSSTA